MHEHAPTVPRRLAYSIPEAAELIGVSRGHLYNLITSGQVASTKLGSRRVIKATELDRLLEDGAR